MPRKPLTDHAKLYDIAEAQAGYFTTAQAQAIGFSRPTLVYHAKTGQFKRVAHGVYRLSRFPASPYEDLFVAWLTVGPQAVISHESALAVYELSDALPSAIHIIMPRTASRRRSGLHLHTHRLQPDETTRRHGLPITTVARTLADVAAAGLAEELVRQAIDEARRRGLVTRSALAAQARRRPGRARQLLQQALQPQPA